MVSIGRVPVTRNGYRYIPAKAVEGKVDCYEEDHYEGRISLSLTDRSREVDLDHLETRCLAWGGPYGSRSVMATHGADRHGHFYYEVELKEPVDGGNGTGHVRVGLGRHGAELGGPVGMSQFSFGFSDTGHIVRSGRKSTCYPTTLKPGDIIGVSVTIREQEDVEFPPPFPPYKLVDYFGIYFEQHFAIRKTSEKHPLLNATFQFHVNGNPVGHEITQIPTGLYYPMISVYRGGRVKFIPESKDMRFLPEGFEPWSSLYSVKRIQYDLGGAVPSIAAAGKSSEGESVGNLCGTEHETEPDLSEPINYAQAV